jgi:hypothetical protein
MNRKGSLPIKSRKQFHDHLFWNIGIMERWNNGTPRVDGMERAIRGKGEEAGR